MFGHFRSARSRLSVSCELCGGSVLIVSLDSACCLPTATGLAAGKAVGEEREEGDDALLRCALVVCLI